MLRKPFVKIFIRLRVMARVPACQVKKKKCQAKNNKQINHLPPSFFLPGQLKILPYYGIIKKSERYETRRYNEKVKKGYFFRYRWRASAG
jgi:hypothetical protein